MSIDNDKSIECDNRKVHTIPAKLARKRVEEVHSLRRQCIVGEELNTIYKRIRETMDGGGDFFVHHICSIEGESKYKENEILSLVKTELLYQGYGIKPLEDGWFEIKW